MAYAPNGLRLWLGGPANMWRLYTQDSVAAATAADYVTDAATNPTTKTAGRGLVKGDSVLICVVADVTKIDNLNPDDPANQVTHTDHAWAYVSDIDAVTGAGTLTAV